MTSPAAAQVSHARNKLNAGGLLLGRGQQARCDVHSAQRAALWFSNSVTFGESHDNFCF
jgi:hypothetical protein